MVAASHLQLVEASEGDAPEALSLVFAALADPVRREILDRLDGQDLLVSEVAGHFDISLQAVSRHLQVLVRAGLVQQQRTGRISRCSLDAGPIHEAAIWLNRYSKYWQDQFDLLAASLAEIAEEAAEQPSPRRAGKPQKAARKTKQPRRGPDR
ncbi:MAG TPA: metalloregulator ArsR/SmtB family transcription factor [Dongiaceae bacterium]|nr:metalloregulator ArsR/SmtB family transcription factor [Dongiaceae bacterium]